MKPLLVAAGVCALALPAMAQKRVDLFFDVEGVRRTGMTSGFTPGITRFEPQFQSGGGVGAGVNWFLSDRVSLETKVAGLGTKARLRVIGSDFVGTADLGWAQIYPISAVIQWHFLEHGFVRPYVGAGAARGRPEFTSRTRPEPLWTPVSNSASARDGTWWPMGGTSRSRQRRARRFWEPLRPLI